MISMCTKPRGLTAGGNSSSNLLTRPLNTLHSRERRYLRVCLIEHYRQTGFTLLEVLIALSILAILMTGLIKIAANNTQNLWFLENTTLAEQVAQNRLLQLRLAENKPETDDGWEEMAGRRWYWQVSRAVAHSLGDGVWRYRVQVFLEGEKTAYVDLVGYVASTS
ncbi:type II secretion system minor pseudopilin GspI [Methylomonas methanica]|uniref:Type II secretion system protein I n=1 Tax=Methylomonas methanica (strain DSM 25384 / MC09) TaxID=857087 RepID=G0A758_METMM|nr:type II secretion system minor pseudopilin GspI [Methylomonas methanica]AEF99351.1 general secretion pathway protein I [Methylomonas methanica MC09]